MKISSTEGLPQHIFYNAVFQAVTYLSTLILTPYLSRVFDGALIGQYAYAHSVATFFALVATLGSTFYGQRCVATHRGNIQKKSEAFWQLTLMRACLAALVGALYLLFIYRQENTLFWLAMGMEILQVAVNLSWFYMGEEDFRRVALFAVISKAFILTATLLFVKTKAHFMRYVFINETGMLLGFLSGWIGIEKRVAGVRLSPDTAKQMKAHLYASASIFMAEASIAIYTVLDKTVLGLLSGSEMQVGCYELAQRTAHVFVMLTTIASTAIASRVCRVRAERGRKKVSRLIEIAFSFVFCISVPAFAFLFLGAGWLVPIFFGAGYEQMIPLVRLFAVMPLVIGCSNVVGMQYLIPIGQEKIMTRTVIAGALVNLTLNLLLIRRFAAVGAVIASLAAETLITCLQLHYVRHEIPLRRIGQALVRYGLYCAPAAAAGWFLMRALRQGLPAFLFTGMVCAAIYAAELFLMERFHIKQLSEEDGI